MSQQTVSGTFTGTGSSGSFKPIPQAPQAHERGTGYFNITLGGTFNATVAIKRSFDDGATWNTVSRDASGLAAEYTAPISVVCIEPEQDVIYKLECTAYASGTVNYRISR